MPPNISRDTMLRTRWRSDGAHVPPHELQSDQGVTTQGTGHGAGAGEQARFSLARSHLPWPIAASVCDRVRVWRPPVPHETLHWPHSAHWNLQSAQVPVSHGVVVVRISGELQFAVCWATGVVTILVYISKQPKAVPHAFVSLSYLHSREQQFLSAKTVSQNQECGAVTHSFGSQ